MSLVFIELSFFDKFRQEHLSDDELRELQSELIDNPEKGELIPGLGGLRKIRIPSKNKGKRGGARVIYYYYVDGSQIWLFTAYNKNKTVDLSSDEKKIFVKVLERLLASAKENE